MSFRVVVLPEPLRPSNTSVSPRATLRFRPEIKGRAGRQPVGRGSKFQGVSVLESIT